MIVGPVLQISLAFIAGVILFLFGALVVNSSLLIRRIRVIRGSE
jgi:hypothetical protein